MVSSDCVDCKICLGTSGETMCIVFPCGNYPEHVFHIACLRPWIANNATCPTCQTKVSQTVQATLVRIAEFFKSGKDDADKKDEKSKCVILRMKEDLP